MIRPKVMDAMIRIGKQWDTFPGGVRPFWFMDGEWNGEPTTMVHTIGRYALYRMPMSDGYGKRTCMVPTCGIHGTSMGVDELIEYRKAHPRQPLVHPHEYVERVDASMSVYATWRMLWRSNLNRTETYDPESIDPEDDPRMKGEVRKMIGEAEWVRPKDYYGFPGGVVYGRSEQGECLLQMSSRWKGRNDV